MGGELMDIQSKAIEHAKKMAGRESKKGFNFESVFTYSDTQGQPIYWKVRAKNHSTGEKWIRVFSFVGNGFKYGDPDFKIVYPAGNGLKPLYALERITQAPPDAVIYITEGEQKADLINGIGLYATTCGGSNNIAATDLAPLQGKAVIIWPDNDSAGTSYLNEIGEKLQALSCAVKHIVLNGLNLPHKGDIVDWVGIRTENGLKTELCDIQGLETAEFKLIAPNEQDKFDKKELAEPMEWENGFFEVAKEGIFFVERLKNGEQRAKFIASPILVLADTRDNTSNNWGRLLQWKDRAMVVHNWAVPMDLFQGDCTELRKGLAYQGASIAPDRRARELLQCYLMSYPVDKFSLCVDTVGWHGKQYVLPTETVGEADTENNDKDIVYQHTDGLDNRYLQCGDLAEWQNQVSKPLQTHNKLVFSVATAFAGQLLEPLNQQGGGFHINGASSKGKSTAIYLASSVWGHPKKFYRTWRATGNALEQTAFMHNDGFLVLDEIGEATAKDIGQTIYMLSNGQGKARMGRSSVVKSPQQWRIMFLSSGEKAFKDILAEIGQNAKLGQEIRLPEINLDSFEHGIFDRVDFAETAGKQANLLYENASRTYGVAGWAWLQYLTKDKTALTEKAQQLYSHYKAQITPADAQGHIERVASRFAVVAVAGELATQANITGWEQGRALQAATQVFNTWLNSFEMVGDYEERDILEQIRAFFQVHGNARFDTITHENSLIQRDPENEHDISSRQTTRQRTLARVGFRFVNDLGEILNYTVPAEVFKLELCKTIGYDAKKVAKALKKHNWLITDYGKVQKTIRHPETKQTAKAYVFDNKAMTSYDIDRATNPAPSTGKTIEI
jgi:uncharacterized protein (DUF927 family)